MKFIIEKKDQVVFPKIYTTKKEADDKANEMAEVFDFEYIVHELK